MKFDVSKDRMVEKKRLHVYASTLLSSNSGNEYEYNIHFTINLETGLPRFVSEKGKIAIRPYMLLHLLNRVYSENGIDIGFPRKPEAQFVKNPKQHPKGKYPYNPALKIFKTGKRYRLDQQVSGDWINSPDILKMIKCVRYLKDYDKETYELIFVEGENSPYHTLNPIHAIVWMCDYAAE